MPLQPVDEESKSREKSAEHAHDDQEPNQLSASGFAGGQSPLGNLNRQEQSSGVADLELDPFKNPNAPVELHQRVMKLLRRLDNQ